MEGIKRNGVFLNEKDIKKLIEKYMNWVEIVPGQIFCAENIMSDQTPSGTSIMVNVDGIKTVNGEDVVRLVLSSGIYELPVKVTMQMDDRDIRFDQTQPLPGTYGALEDGQLNILTDEETVFCDHVNKLLGNRTDEYAERIRRDNIRNVGGRGLILLEKMKEEIKKDPILKNSLVSPTQLVSMFIVLTAQLKELEVECDDLTKRQEDLEMNRSEYGDKESKEYKKIMRDLTETSERLQTDNAIRMYLTQTIVSSLAPILDSELCEFSSL